MGEICRASEPSVDVVIPTQAGADVNRACGCTERLDPDWDAWFVVTLCGEHSNLSDQADRNLPRLLGAEMDQHVAEACGGRRVERIMPKDHTKHRGKR